MTFTDADYARAEKLFESFHDRAPKGNEIAQIVAAENLALAVGSLYGIIYKTTGERKPFIHRFNKFDRPLLYVSSNGRQIYTLKGAYRFTNRGFVG